MRANNLGKKVVPPADPTQLPVIDIKLTPKQKEVLLSPATEIFFGGAAGPGKSFLLRAAAIFYCTKIPNLQVYLIRRLSPDLKKNHLEGVTGFRSLLRPWVDQGLATVTEHECRFWNHSAIHLGHCEEEKDKYKYQGPEINMLLVDELTHFTESQYRFIRGRTRLGSLRSSIPAEYKKKFPLIICASNPGNIGHEWVKRTFVDMCEPGVPLRVSREEGGKLRAFFPALMTDNPYLEEDYADTLEGLGSDELVEAMKFGNWNVLQGAFFSEFSRRKHMIEPFKVPVHWTRIFSMDWGYWFPFAMDWWAVAEEDFLHPITGQKIPQGAMVCYRQWYGTTKVGSNLGIGMDPEEAGRKLKKMEAAAEGEPDLRVADPDIWKSDKTVTTASLFRKVGVRLSQADNTHTTGYIELKRRLKGDGGVPEIYWFDTCINAERNFTNAVRDEADPSEIQKGCEIHACDSARYAVMAVKQGIQATSRREDIELDTRLTYGALLEEADKWDLRRRMRHGPLECD